VNQQDALSVVYGTRRGQVAPRLVKHATYRCVAAFNGKRAFRYVAGTKGAMAFGKATK
jgi:hypothetical protein